MADKRFSKLAAEAIRLLGELGRDVKPAIPSGEMYELEYDDAPVLITVAADDDELHLSCPIYIFGDSSEEIWESYRFAEFLCEEHIKDYTIDMAREGLWYIWRVHTLPEGESTLTYLRLLGWLEDISEAYMMFQSCAGVLAD